MTYTKFFHSDAKEKNSNPVTKRTHDTVSCLNTAVNATITVFFSSVCNRRRRWTQRELRTSWPRMLNSNWMLDTSKHS